MDLIGLRVRPGYVKASPSSSIRSEIASGPSDERAEQAARYPVPAVLLAAAHERGPQGYKPQSPGEGAWPFHRAAVVNARHGTATVDALILADVAAAYLWSLYALAFGDAGQVGMRMSASPGWPGTAGPAPPI